MSETLRQRFLDDPREWVHKHGARADYWADALDGKMYVKICPGGKIHEHVDTVEQRIHFVLQTCEGAVCVSAGEEFHLEEGGIYRIDPRVPHYSFNEGDKDRIHLVVG